MNISIFMAISAVFFLNTTWGEVIITKVCPHNLDGPSDYYQQERDWIEISNPTQNPQNLKGYTLQLAGKNTYHLPAGQLKAGERKILFASGKGSVGPSGKWHTNFTLPLKGGELKLSCSDGPCNTFEDVLKYPSMPAHLCYGKKERGEVFRLLDRDDSVKYFVPSSGEYDEAWMRPDFDDSKWPQSPLALGYDLEPTYDDFIKTDLRQSMYLGSIALYTRSKIALNNDQLEKANSLSLFLHYEDGIVVYLNGHKVFSDNAPENVNFKSKARLKRDESLVMKGTSIDLSPHLELLKEGQNLLAIHTLNTNSSSSDHLLNGHATLTAYNGSTDELIFFQSPVPYSPNTKGWAGLAKANLNLPKAQMLFSDQQMSLRLNAKTKWEHNKFPNPDSPDTPKNILVNESLFATVAAHNPGQALGEMHYFHFLRASQSLQDYKSELPILVIDTYKARLSGKAPQSGSLFVYNQKLQANPDYDSKIEIHKRGSSSLGFPKNNYALEFQDSVKRDQDVNFLGLSTDSDWVLHGPYSDKSLIRNVLAFELARQLGHYAPRTRFVELFFNEDNGVVEHSDYRGLYVLMEKIKRNPKRVAISKMQKDTASGEDLTGGYLFKIDRLGPMEKGFKSNLGVRFAHVYPKERNIHQAQKNYLKNYIDDFEKALMGRDFNDPDKGYRAFIDVPSFVDFFILVELLKNIDGYRLSTFLSKDKNKKMVMGPLWDFNLSLGNANYLNGHNPEGFYWRNIKNEKVYAWWDRFLFDFYFHQQVATRWSELRKTLLQTPKLNQLVDSYYEKLAPVAEKNFARWPILGRYVWPNHFVGKTYGEEIDFLKNFLNRRLKWLDGQWVQIPLAKIAQ